MLLSKSYQAASQIHGGKQVISRAMDGKLGRLARKFFHMFND
jgi:hypothetical protein